MTFLYNCKHDGDQFRISKFDSYMNVESSYLCTEEECTCPAGVRPICRHRSMLPKFIKRGYVGTEFFFDFDRGGWVQMGDEWKRQEIEDTTDIMIELANNLPEGVTAIIMDSHDKVVDVHNAIAEAVGEAHMNITATEIDERMAQLTLPSLDLTEQLDALSGIIEKALNETGYVKEPPSPTHMKRRF